MEKFPYNIFQLLKALNQTNVFIDGIIMKGKGGYKYKNQLCAEEKHSFVFAVQDI